MTHVSNKRVERNTIRRTAYDKDHPFTRVSNDLLNDERLSLDTIGLAVWILSKPDNWVFHKAHIAKTFKIGRTQRLSRIIRELRDAGYLPDDGRFEFSEVPEVMQNRSPAHSKVMQNSAQGDAKQVTKVMQNSAVVTTESVTTEATRERALARTPIPANLELTAGMIEFAFGQGWDVGRTKTEFEKFKAYYTSRQTLLADWQGATWQSWVMKGIGFDKQQPQRRDPNSMADAFFALRTGG